MIILETISPMFLITTKFIFKKPCLPACFIAKNVMRPNNIR
jgi:hypothetical protein